MSSAMTRRIQEAGLWEARKEDKEKYMEIKWVDVRSRHHSTLDASSVASFCTTAKM